MAVYHIDWGTAVNGSGSALSPFNTPASLPALNPGDKVLFKQGSSQLQAAYNQRITIGQSGAAGNHIVVGAYYNVDSSMDMRIPLPIIKPSHSTSLGDRAVYCGAQNYVKVNYLDIDGSLLVQSAQHSGVEWSTTTGSSVEHCHIHGVTASGANAGNGVSVGSSVDFSLLHNVIESVADDGCNISNTSGLRVIGNTTSLTNQANRNQGDGLQFSGNCTNAFIFRNKVTQHIHYKQGIVLSGAAAGSGAIIWGNSVDRSGVIDPSGGPCILCDQPGALILENKTWGGAAGIAALANGIKIYSNRVYGALLEAVYLNTTNTGVRVVGNILGWCKLHGIYSDATAVAAQILHNTIHSAGSTGTGAGVAGGSLVRNNAFVGFATGVSGAGAAGTSDHNAYHQVASQHAGAITDSGGHVLGDPNFDSDFVPGHQSALIGAGANLVAPLRDVDRALFRVVGPTIGAVETRRRWFLQQAIP